MAEMLMVSQREPQEVIGLQSGERTIKAIPIANGFHETRPNGDSALIEADLCGILESRSVKLDPNVGVCLDSRRDYDRRRLVPTRRPT